MSAAHDREETGPSWRILVLSFFILVALCAVVFSLGYMVGYKGRSPAEALATETLTPPANGVAGGSTPSAPPAAGSRVAPQNPVAASSHESKPFHPPATQPSAKAVHAISPTVIRKTTGAKSLPMRSALRGGHFEVQVTALTAKADAARLTRILKDRGFPAFVVTPESSGVRDNLYRVEVGPYRTRADALLVRGKLEQAGFGKPFIRP